MSDAMRFALMTCLRSGRLAPAGTVDPARRRAVRPVSGLNLAESLGLGTAGGIERGITWLTLSA
jgi:hypothetical protein